MLDAVLRQAVQIHSTRTAAPTTSRRAFLLAGFFLSEHHRRSRSEQLEQVLLAGRVQVPFPPAAEDVLPEQRQLVLQGLALLLEFIAFAPQFVIGRRRIVQHAPLLVRMAPLPVELTGQRLAFQPQGRALCGDRLAFRGERLALGCERRVLALQLPDELAAGSQVERSVHQSRGEENGRSVTTVTQSMRE
jgi:hypothetical protein